jgi:hypothetical protein
LDTHDISSHNGLPNSSTYHTTNHGKSNETDYVSSHNTEPDQHTHDATDYISTHETNNGKSNHGKSDNWKTHHLTFPPSYKCSPNHTHANDAKTNVLSPWSPCKCVVTYL